MKKLFYGDVFGNLVFIPKRRALYLAQLTQAVHTASTWEELSSLLTWDQWRELRTYLFESIEYAFEDFAQEKLEEDPEAPLSAAWEEYRRIPPGRRMPLEDDPFSPEQIPGFCDGDWPAWPAQEMLDWVPESIQSRFGHNEETLLNGSFLNFDPAQEDAIVAAFREEGYTCQRNDDLVLQASGYPLKPDEGSRPEKETLRAADRASPAPDDSSTSARTETGADSDESLPEGSAAEVSVAEGTARPRCYYLGEMLLCPHCGEIFGPWGCWETTGENSSDTVPELPPRENWSMAEWQHCGCPRQNPEKPEPRWPGFDFNKLVELCHCCGLEPVRSGSKFSVWFCEECKERVCRLNAEYQRVVIPLGRHSVHSGLLLTGSQAKDPAEVSYFVHRVREMEESIDRVRKAARASVLLNLQKLGFPLTECVLLWKYLSAPGRAQLDKAEAFQRLCSQFGIHP